MWCRTLPIFSWLETRRDELVASDVSAARVKKCHFKIRNMNWFKRETQKPQPQPQPQPQNERCKDPKSYIGLLMFVYDFALDASKVNNITLFGFLINKLKSIMSSISMTSSDTGGQELGQAFQDAGFSHTYELAVPKGRFSDLDQGAAIEHDRKLCITIANKIIRYRNSLYPDKYEPNAGVQIGDSPNAGVQTGGRKKGPSTKWVGTKRKVMVNKVAKTVYENSSTGELRVRKVTNGTRKYTYVKF